MKGLLAEIIEVKDATHATALEVVAGGRLYNVVVDSHITGMLYISDSQTHFAK